MNTKKMLCTLMLLVASTAILPAAHAGEQDQATKMTFSQSVQIPGHVLPAGTYWFVLANGETTSYQETVRIFNADRTILYATLFTIETQPSTPIATGAVTLADRGSGQPKAVLSWLYPRSWYFPGFEYGHQFVYSNSDKQELAGAKQQTVTSGD